MALTTIEPVADDTIPGRTQPADAYAVFCGPIDQQVLGRVSQTLLRATRPRKGVAHIHLLFQSTGGTVGDCVCLYNLLRSLPVELTLYNAGAIQSGAVTAYLGAKHRKTSAYAQFMIHRSYCSPQFATLPRLEASVNSLRLDDERTEAIIRSQTHIPEALWTKMKETDVFFSGLEAVEYGVADAIGEFSPPSGAQVYYL